jgi:hypothetical protein
MEDQLAILHGLWGQPDGWSYDGPGLDPEPTFTRSLWTSREGRGRPSGAHGLGCSSAGRVHRARIGSLHAMRTSSTSVHRVRRGRATCSRPWTRRASPSTATRRH